MENFWIKFMVWTEYIIPIAIVAIFLIISIICSCIKAFKWNRKINWLKNHGYERYLSGVPSFGSGAFYSWKNEQTGKRVDERDLKWMSYSRLVNEMKG
ncbi:MAG: hypothetical protein Q4F79_03205 [Eubacteriales bacterium]|nr:hypothetical protein [Eubacteriales bacterium]